MPDRFNKTYRYLKGIYEAKFFDAERNLQYYDNQLTDANFETSVNLGELTAGVGNPTVIQLPDTARFNVTLTAADIDLRSRWLQTGGVLGYNGITDTCELITAEDASVFTGTCIIQQTFSAQAAAQAVSKVFGVIFFVSGKQVKRAPLMPRSASSGGFSTRTDSPNSTTPSASTLCSIRPFSPS